MTPSAEEVLKLLKHETRSLWRGSKPQMVEPEGSGIVP